MRTGQHLAELYVQARVILDLGLEKGRFEWGATRKRGWTPVKSDDGGIDYWRATTSEYSTSLMMVSEVLKALANVRVPSRASRKEVVHFARIYYYLRHGLESAQRACQGGSIDVTPDGLKAALAAVHKQRSSKGGLARRKFKSADEEREAVAIVAKLLRAPRVSPNASFRRAVPIIEEQMGIKVNYRTVERAWKRQKQALSK